jgi:O-methyltransferase involved in polyketide biosynthesis
MVKRNIIKDPLAAHCLESIMRLASADDKEQMAKMTTYASGSGFHDARSNGDRAMVLDAIAGDYIAGNPGCTVVNLACGFDTRYWRIDHTKCRYIEVDLPEVVALKREILKDRIGYELIGCSVLDYSWIDKVTEKGNRDMLLIAEGLLMYLPEPLAVPFLQTLPQRFVHSRFLFDMVPKFATKGVWKKILARLSRKYFGFTVSMEFGFKKPGDIEAVSHGFKVISDKRMGGRLIIQASIN